MDLNVNKYTTTQEMFLAKVGITNSYQEDNLTLCAPFFVILPKASELFAGNTRHIVCIHQKEPIVLRFHLQEKRDDDGLHA